MNRGIVYVMTTAVSGLIKIGRAGTDNFLERMRFLEANGYYNVSGLKKFFAIELDDYEDKEKLIHEIFNKHQVGESELFALDKDLVKQLLLSFSGKVVFPDNIDQEKQFDEVTKIRKQGALFNFYRKGLKNGDEIAFIDDPTIIATVCGERDVLYGGQTWKLSPLTYKIYEDRGELNTSGAYQGAAYWTFKGERLTKIPDKE
ncbi:GIY-YIG nuclease family protein [Candidatus Saccharibacteria bacterium]|nr:GIY-YIG nuclease family protein [Candidatus Saccharibacteria bacterium]